MDFSVRLDWPLNVSPCQTPRRSLQEQEEVRERGWGCLGSGMRGGGQKGWVL